MSGLPAFVTLGRTMVERFFPGRFDVCISIGDPDLPPAKLQPGWRDVLVLQFDDLDIEVPPGTLCTSNVSEEGRPVVPIAEEHAAQIVAFARKHRRARRIVVHCEAGASRSVSTAIALSVVLGGPKWWPDRYPEQWKRTDRVPNKLVYDAVLRAGFGAPPIEPTP